MKTAVSIPDGLFRRAEELAQRLGKSRSQVYREALAKWITHHDTATVTVALNDVVEELDTGIEAWSAEAARRALERSEW